MEEREEYIKLKKNKCMFLKKIIVSAMVIGVLSTSGSVFAVDEKVKVPAIVQDEGNSLQNLKLSSKGVKKSTKKPWIEEYREATKEKEGYDPLDLKQDSYIEYVTSYGRYYIGPKKQKVSISDVKFSQFGGKKISINGKNVNEDAREKLIFNVKVDPRLADVSSYNIKETIPYLLKKGLPIAKTSIQILNSETGKCLSGQYGASKDVKVTIYEPKKIYFENKEHKKTYYETNATSTKVEVEYPVSMKNKLCIAVSGLDHQYVHNKDRKKEITKFENGHVTFDESIIESSRKGVNHLIKVSDLK